jgi:heme oxygenase
MTTDHRAQPSQAERARDEVVGGSVGAADRLRSATADLHARAESTGVVRDLLRGTASRASYTSYLRNLHAVYECLERELRARCREPQWETLAAPRVYRAEAIAADLRTLVGPAWRELCPLVAATQRYCDRIRSSAQGSDARLAAHAYTRYLGDLNGGAIVAKVVSRSLSLSPDQLRTYRYDDVDDLPAFKAVYRRAFDFWKTAERELIDETIAAFGLNIELAQEVAACPSPGLSAVSGPAERVLGQVLQES